MVRASRFGARTINTHRPRGRHPRGASGVVLFDLPPRITARCSRSSPHALSLSGSRRLMFSAIEYVDGVPIEGEPQSML